ncbi:MAG: aminotransferase class I/II-fold pyridoxal phosphate-dependent enzyme, partial [Sphaerochaetaceae bacterium]|nr:aminotransferase class I/II-fold pyridoxal phosphate-dependent enzyme [Sphaerochaetaceae bacterium]
MRKLLRPNIANLIPYSCARNDFTGVAKVYLDANENWSGLGLGRNRYPDPLCEALRHKMEEVLGLPFDNTVIGNGSDEIIDNLIRMFCIPSLDKVIIQSPTYGAYKVFCDINDVETVDIPLKEDFSMDLEALEKAKSCKAKLLFICSPNNPTANAFALEDIEKICSSFEGIVVVDEAYIDFSSKGSAIGLLKDYPNLVIMRTLSKCWAQANSRLGIMISSKEICSVMRSMKYPYNVGGPSQEEGLKALENIEEVKKQ